jgi:hypothetical protein
MSSVDDSEIEPALHAYRIFIFDHRRCLRRTELIECASDKDAIVKAAEVIDGCLRGWRIELWHLARRVFSREIGVIAILLASNLSDGSLGLFGLLS